MKLIDVFFGIQIAHAYNLEMNPGGDIKVVAARLLAWALYLLGAVAIGAIIYSGILFITSLGDAEKVKKARTALLWSILGIILIGLSYGIVAYINSMI